MKYGLTIMSLVIFLQVKGQQVNQAIQSANDLYRVKQYDQANQGYEEALRLQPGNITAKYNKTHATYRLGKAGEAIKSYDEIAATVQDGDLRSKAYYNKGAILSQQKKLEESIEAYKQSLRLNPNDMEARENLQKALLELKKKQPPRPKEDQQKKKQEQKQPQPKMNKKEAEQRLKLLEQKEKEVQQRLQKEKSKTGGSQTKDW